MNFRYKQIAPDLTLVYNHHNDEVGVITPDNQIVLRRIHRTASKIYLDSLEIGYISRFNERYLVQLYNHTFEAQNALKSHPKRVIWALIKRLHSWQLKKMEKSEYRFRDYKQFKVVG